MTYERFQRLPKIIRDMVASKAKECDLSIEDYLKGTDSNYCILTSNPYNPTPCFTGDSVFNYVVYGEKVGAEEDLDAVYDIAVVTEEQMIIILSGLATLLNFKQD